MMAQTLNLRSALGQSHDQFGLLDHHALETSQEWHCEDLSIRSQRLEPFLQVQVPSNSELEFPASEKRVPGLDLKYSRTST